jgi:hypothetical protein
MAQNDREFTWLFHDATKHTVESVRGGGHFLDFANMPLPLKYYPDLEPIPLPVDLPERNAPAVEVLSGRVDAAPGPWGLPALARVLFFSAGVTRRARLVSGRPIFLRAAASAGGLYPVEVYVAQAATHHLVVVEHEHGAATAMQSSASFITPSAKSGRQRTPLDRGAATAPSAPIWAQ